MCFNFFKTRRSQLIKSIHHTNKNNTHTHTKTHLQTDNSCGTEDPRAGPCTQSEKNKKKIKHSLPTTNSSSHLASHTRINPYTRNKSSVVTSARMRPSADRRRRAFPRRCCRESQEGCCSSSSRPTSPARLRAGCSSSVYSYSCINIRSPFLRLN